MKDNRDTEMNLQVADFVAELRRLADALEADGTFEIEIDGEMVQVPADAVISIEHEREDGREELEFQLKWGEPEDEEEDEEEADDEEEEEDAAQ